MDNESSFFKRMGNCCRIHWNGFFYAISPLVLLPLVFCEPIVENRTIYVLLLVFIWYVVDCMPQGVTSCIPIMAFPFLGVLPSAAVCMAYCLDSQMVFLLSCFLAVCLYTSQVDRLLAFRCLNLFGVNPRRLLLTYMLLAFFLTSFLPTAMVCTFMISITRATLQILEQMNVCKAIDDTIVVKFDENPYPSNEACALYIGVAYAANIGGMLTLWSCESGFELMEYYADMLPNSATTKDIVIKYLLISIPTTIILLLCTMLYLQLLFLRQRQYDLQNAPTALKALYTQEPAITFQTSLTLTLMILFVIMITVVAVGKAIENEYEKTFTKYSCYLMLACFIIFVLPNDWRFLNYFRCRKPAEYKTAPSVLHWTPVPKYTPWSMFLTYGCSLSMALAFKNSGLYLHLCGNFIKENSVVKRQLSFTSVCLVCTILLANHMVTRPMLSLALQSGFLSRDDPSLLTIPILLACNMSFILPVSSVSNCFATGWGNLRSRDLIKAGLPPTIIGYLLVFAFTTLARAATTMFDNPAYNSIQAAPVGGDAGGGEGDEAERRGDESFALYQFLKLLY